MLRLNETVGRLVAERPNRSRVFEEFGIDYCCGGKRSLQDACTKAEVNPATVLQRIAEVDTFPVEPSEDWEFAPLGTLCDHVIDTHHAFLRRELPRTRQLLTKVARAHGMRHPEMCDVLKVFEQFADELLLHMIKEEKVLFPRIRMLEEGGSLENVMAAIRVMEDEHDQAGAWLAAMRQLTNGFTPPTDACSTFRVALAALRGIEADMHVHVHKENNILFVRVEDLLWDTVDSAVV